MARQSGGSKLPPLTLLFHGENPPASSLRHVVPVSSERFDAFPVLLLHAATATMQASQRHDSQSSLEIIDDNSCSHTHTRTPKQHEPHVYCAPEQAREDSGHFVMFVLIVVRLLFCINAAKNNSKS